MKVVIFYYRVEDNEACEQQLLPLLDEVPEEKRQLIRNSKNLKRRVASLTGLYLLKTALQHLELPFKLLDVIYNDRDASKPRFAHGPDFNISHSGQFVVCALSQHGQLGIDIERIRAIRGMPFARYLNEEVCTVSETDPVPFFNLWSKKEAVAKTRGEGIKALSRIEVNGEQADYQEQNWYLHAVDIDRDYICWLATSCEPTSIELHPLDKICLNEK